MIIDPTEDELLIALVNKVDGGARFAQVALNHKPAAVVSVAHTAEECGWRAVSVWHQGVTAASDQMIDCTYVLLRYEAP